MLKLDKHSLLAVVASIMVLGVVSPAYAQVLQVPEPSMFGLVATSVVGVLLAVRLRNRK